MFFFTLENAKCPRKRFLVLFLVFFSGGNFFLAHFFEIFSRAVWSFSGTFFVFFLGLIFVFLGQNFKNFLGQTFFFSGRIFSAGVKFFNGFQGWFFAKLERVVNFCYRRNFANVPLVSATGKMKILFFVKRNSKV